LEHDGGGSRVPDGERGGDFLIAMNKWLLRWVLRRRG